MRPVLYALWKVIGIDACGGPSPMSNDLGRDPFIYQFLLGAIYKGVSGTLWPKFYGQPQFFADPTEPPVKITEKIGVVLGHIYRDKIGLTVVLFQYAPCLWRYYIATCGLGTALVPVKYDPVPNYMPGIG